VIAILSAEGKYFKTLTYPSKDELFEYIGERLAYGAIIYNCFAGKDRTGVLKHCYYCCAFPLLVKE